MYDKDLAIRLSGHICHSIVGDGHRDAFRTQVFKELEPYVTIVQEQKRNGRVGEIEILEMDPLKVRIGWSPTSPVNQQQLVETMSVLIRKLELPVNCGEIVLTAMSNILNENIKDDSLINKEDVISSISAIANRLQDLHTRRKNLLDELESNAVQIQNEILNMNSGIQKQNKSTIVNILNSFDNMCVLQVNSNYYNVYTEAPLSTSEEDIEDFLETQRNTEEYTKLATWLDNGQEHKCFAVYQMEIKDTGMVSITGLRNNSSVVYDTKAVVIENKHIAVYDCFTTNKIINSFNEGLRTQDFSMFKILLDYATGNMNLLDDVVTEKFNEYLKEE